VGEHKKHLVERQHSSSLAKEQAVSKGRPVFGGPVISPYVVKDMQLAGYRSNT
jgi:hypothetical protein